jgi:hypothetical protein
LFENKAFRLFFRGSLGLFPSVMSLSVMVTSKVVKIKNGAAMNMVLKPKRRIMKPKVNAEEA